MTAIRWHRHWTDHKPDPLQPRKLRRTLSNWANYKTPSGVWTASSPDIRSSTGTPDDWVGQYDFREDSSQAPLQTYYEDARDANNTAMVGMRLSDDPSSWVNYKAADIDNSVPMTKRRGNTVGWDELWNNCDLLFHHSRHKVDKEIVLKNAAHPASFKFTVLIPDGYTLQIRSNRGAILNGRGEQVLSIDV